MGHGTAPVCSVVAMEPETPADAYHMYLHSDPAGWATRSSPGWLDVAAELVRAAGADWSCTQSVWSGEKTYAAGTLRVREHTAPDSGTPSWLVWHKDDEALKLAVDQTQPDLDKPPPQAYRVPYAPTTLTFRKQQLAEEQFAPELWSEIFGHCTFDDMVAARQCCSHWRDLLVGAINRCQALTGISIEPGGRGYVVTTEGIRRYIDRLPPLLISLCSLYCDFEETEATLEKVLKSRKREYEALRSTKIGEAAAAGLQELSAAHKELLEPARDAHDKAGIALLAHQLAKPQLPMARGDTLQRATDRLWLVLQQTARRDGNRALTPFEAFFKPAGRFHEISRDFNTTVMREWRVQMPIATVLAIMHQFGWDQRTVATAWQKSFAHNLKKAEEFVGHQFDICQDMLKKQSLTGGTVQVGVLFDFVDPFAPVQPPEPIATPIMQVSCSRDPADGLATATRLISKAQFVDAFLHMLADSDFDLVMQPVVIALRAVSDNRPHAERSDVVAALGAFVLVDDQGNSFALGGETPSPIRVDADKVTLRLRPRPEIVWNTLTLAKDYGPDETWTNVRVDPVPHGTWRVWELENVVEAISACLGIRAGFPEQFTAMSNYLRAQYGILDMFQISPPTPVPEGDKAYTCSVNLDVTTLPPLRQLEATADTVHWNVDAHSAFARYSELQNCYPKEVGDDEWGDVAKMAWEQVKEVAQTYVDSIESNQKTVVITAGAECIADGWGLERDLADSYDFLGNDNPVGKLRTLLVTHVSTLNLHFPEDPGEWDDCPLGKYYVYRPRAAVFWKRITNLKTIYMRFGPQTALEDIQEFCEGVQAYARGRQAFHNLFDRARELGTKIVIDTPHYDAVVDGLGLAGLGIATQPGL